jgi:hypothetical protein
MKFKIFIPFFALLMAFSCKKESPFVSKGEIDQFIYAQRIEFYDFCFVFDNDIFYLDSFSAPIKQITSSPAITKQKLRINYDHDKIAFKNANSGLLEIIDLEGELIDNLTGYSGVKTFDWTADGETLIMLQGNSLSFYGPVPSIPSLSIPSIVSPGSSQNVIDFSINKAGDIAYIIQWQAPFPSSDGGHLLVMKANDGTNSELIYEGGWDNMNDMNYVKIDPNSKALIIGYGYPIIESIDLFYDFQEYRSLNLASSESYSDPIFNFDKKDWLSGYKGANGAVFSLLKRDFENFPANDAALSGFESDTPIYIDWK